MAILILDTIGRVFLEIRSLKSLFLGGDKIIGGVMESSYLNFLSLNS